jgi:hypothetical protein
MASALMLMDAHKNRLLEDVKEMWTEFSKGGKGWKRG